MILSRREEQFRNTFQITDLQKQMNDVWLLGLHSSCPLGGFMLLFDCCERVPFEPFRDCGGSQRYQISEGTP